VIRRRQAEARRFLVDHCVPAGVSRWLRSAGYDETWTAYEAGLEEASDENLIIYAQSRRAVLVTTNRDCARRAQRMEAASSVWLKVTEVDVEPAIGRAIAWLDVNQLPRGRVLMVPKHGALSVLPPNRR
jgi:predicted nuclease of predicted toxin-antitoxin system